MVTDAREAVNSAGNPRLNRVLGPQADIDLRFAGTTMLSEVKFTLRLPGRDEPYVKIVVISPHGRLDPTHAVTGRFHDFRESKATARLAWSRGSAAFSHLMLEYKATGQIEFFVADSDQIATVWTAFKRTSWIDEIFGELDGKRVARWICHPGDGRRRRLAIDQEILPRTSVRIFDAEGNDFSTEGLKELARNVSSFHEPHANRRAGRSQNHTPPEFQIREAMWSQEARPPLPTIDVLNRLHTAGMAGKITRSRAVLFMLPDLAIASAVLEGSRTIQEVATRTGLPSSSIRSRANGMGKLVKQSEDLLSIAPFDCKIVVFDWTKTLVDEEKLDDAINEFIYAGKDTRQTQANRSRYFEVLERAKRETPNLWYDYPELAKRFGKTLAGLRNCHRRYGHTLRPLFDFQTLIRQLRSLGILCALATNCHGEILKMRFEILHRANPNFPKLPLDLFDEVVTSDHEVNVVDKEAHLKIILKDRKPKNCLFVSDDLERDLVPGKALGCRTVWVAAGPPVQKSPIESSYLDADRTKVLALRQMIRGNVADFCVENASSILPLRPMPHVNSRREVLSAHHV